MVSLNGKQKQPPHVRQRGNETEISCNFLDLLGIYMMIGKIFGKLFRRQTPLYSEPVVQELSDECRKLIQNYDRQQIPEFLYMPNAYKNGTIQRKSGICECCGDKVEYIYTGMVYSVQKIDCLCPWCIATGVASMRYHAEFNDPASSDIDDTVIFRTPAISGWQQIQWESCCGKAMVYLEAIENRKVLKHYRHDNAFEDAIREVGFGSFDKIEELLPEAGSGSLLVHVFQCRYCGKYKLIFDAD